MLQQPVQTACMHLQALKMETTALRRLTNAMKFKTRRDVTLNNANVVEDFLAAPVPTLELTEFDEAVICGEINLSWTYRHIDHNDTVEILLNRGGGWETIGSDIPVVTGKYPWSIDGPATDNAVLRLEKTNDATVFSEFEFAIQPPESCDINMDGDVNLIDAIHALRILTDTSSLESVCKDVEINGDDVIGLEELIYILRKVSGL